MILPKELSAMIKNTFNTCFPLMLILLRTTLLHAQPNTPTRLFRVFEDNDFFNIAGKGTDQAYTNGLRFDLFYQKRRQSRFHLDDWMPKAGVSSIDVYGWSLMQMMVTPGNLKNPNFQDQDYPYSGVLYLSHSLASYNKTKKYSFQTEILTGIRGPASLAEQSQILIHRLINDQKPQGWQNQLNTKALFNISFSAEKQLTRIANVVEIIGGAGICAGTLTNAITVYPLIRIGKMAPYFEGFFSQYADSGKDKKSKKLQLYLFAKPKLSLIASNALMQGRIENSPETIWEGQPPSTAKVNRFSAEFDFGLVVVTGKLSLSYTQKPITAYTKGMYPHNTGNISLYASW